MASVNGLFCRGIGFTGEGLLGLFGRGLGLAAATVFRYGPFGLRRRRPGTMGGGH